MLMLSGRCHRRHAPAGGWTLGAGLPGRGSRLVGQFDGQKALRSAEVSKMIEFSDLPKPVCPCYLTYLAVPLRSCYAELLVALVSSA